MSISPFVLAESQRRWYSMIIATLTASCSHALLLIWRHVEKGETSGLNQDNNMRVKYRVPNDSWEKELHKLADLAAKRTAYDRLKESDEDFCLNRLKKAGMEQFAFFDAEMVYVNYEEFYGVVLDDEGYYHRVSLYDVQCIEV